MDIYDSIRDGDTEAVREYLRAGGDPNVALKHSMTPLTCAADKGQLAIVDLLLTAGADPNLPDGSNRTTALIYAAMRGNLEVVRRLIAAGADVAYTNKIYQSAISSAAIKNGERFVEVARILLDHGAAPEVKAGPSVLITACQFALPEMVELLLDGGSPINGTDLSGTALISAVLNNRPDVVQLLLARGADPDIAAPEGATCDSTGDDIARLTPVAIAKKRRAVRMLKLLADAAGAKAAPVAPVAATWRRVEAALYKSAPDALGSLLPPGDGDRVREAFADAGLPLPPALRESIGVHDGQDEAGTAIASAAGGEAVFRLLSAAEIVSNAGLVPAVSAKTGAVDSGGRKRKGDTRVRLLPFAHDGMGNFLCVRLDSDDGGPVVLYDHEKDGVVVVQDSYPAWLADLAAYHES